MRRATIPALLAAGLLVVAGYAAFWFVAARHVVAELEAWLAAPHGRLDVAVGAITVSGFPTRLEVTAAPVAVRVGRDFSYAAESLVLSRPLRSEDLAFALRGPQSFTVQGLRIGIETAGTTGELVRRADGAIAAFRVGANGVAVHLPDAAPVRVQRLEMHAEGADGAGAVPDGATLTVHAEAITAPGRVLLGDEIALLDATLRLHGALSAPTRSALLDWQRRDGHISILESSLRWGPLAAGGINGTLRMDASLRPAGVVETALVDLPGLLAALASAAWISSDQAAALLERVVPQDGGTHRYRLSFLDGWAAFNDIDPDQTAPIPLWRLPSVPGLGR